MWAVIIRGSVACLAATVPFSSSAQTVGKPQPAAEPGLFYQPNEGPAGIRSIKVHDLVLDRPTRWGLSARPDVAISFQTSKGPKTIVAGSILPVVRIDGLPGVAAGVPAFCTVKRDTTMGQRNELWGPLWSRVLGSLSDGRICLLDRDGDGKAESAFLLGTGTEADHALRAIEPVTLNIAPLRERGDGYRVQIMLLQGRRPNFRIRILEAGRPLEFQSIAHDTSTEDRDQAVPNGAHYPIDYTIFGAHLKIVGYDASTGLATIEYPAADQSVVEVPNAIRVHYKFGY